MLCIRERLRRDIATGPGEKKAWKPFARLDAASAQAKDETQVRG
jgi:hypothetical protein